MPPVNQASRLFNGGVDWPLQRAGIAALAGLSNPTNLMRIEYQARRDLIVNMLADAPSLDWKQPQATFYAFVRYDRPISATRAQALLAQHGLRIRSGTEYGPGGESHVRLSFAANRKVIAAGVRRLIATLAVGDLASPVRTFREETS